jgi:hypothetical protein
VGQNLNVASAGEMVALLFQVLPQFQVVIDFPITNHPNLASLIAHGLGAPRHVDNGKAGHAKPNGPFLVKTLVIRAPVLDRLGHFLEMLHLQGLARLKLAETRYAAHKNLLTTEFTKYTG